jgi:hypothetical protein
MPLLIGPFSETALSEAREEIDTKHAKVLAVSQATYDQLCRVLEKAEWRSTLSEHVMYSLAARCLEHFACVYQAARCGTVPAAKVLTRSLIETTYKLRAVQMNSELATQFILDNEAAKLAKLKGLQKYKQKSGVSGLAPGIEETIDAISAEKPKKFEPHQWASAAEMEDFHSLFYHWLSEEVHTSASAVDSYFVDDPEFTIVVGPDDKDLRHTLVIACRCARAIFGALVHDSEPETAKWLNWIESELAYVESEA